MNHQGETALDRVMDLIDPSLVESPHHETTLRDGLHVAQIVSLDGSSVHVRLNREKNARHARLGESVEADLIREANENGQSVLLDSFDGKLLVVGILQTKRPQKLTLQAEKVELLGSRSITLKSGRAALELRADGSVELLGTRIAATSRGVMKFIARALRLN